MRKQKTVSPIITKAFVIWLKELGYKAIATHCGIKFTHPQSGSKFPKGVMLMSNGRLNKPASQLYREFASYEPFENVDLISHLEMRIAA